MTKNFDTLEVGRTYLNRNGDEVEIVKCDKDFRYLWPFWCDRYAYTMNGFWKHGGTPHGLDLIKLLPEPDDQADSKPDNSKSEGMIDLIEKSSRKAIPIYTGVLKYFPGAIAEVARCSYVGNEQHNPGTALHWDRNKSGDELDALTRHLMEAGKIDADGIRHSTKIAWRALSNLQKELENHADKTKQPD